MRVVFMGTPDFGVPPLRALAAVHEVVAVYTQPDRPRGRGRDLVPSPVKVAAQELGLAVIQPGTMRDPAAQQALADLAPEVICVAAFGMILPSEVLAIPALGCLNVHASLLPRYRGAAPVHRAILDGAEETGVAIMQMEEGLDTGPYAHPQHIAVDDKDVAALTDALAVAGAEALLVTLDELERGAVDWTTQDDGLATYAPKITAADVALSPDLTVDAALRRIRASTPSARSRLCVAGTTIEVIAAHRFEAVLERGHVMADKSGVALGFTDGAVALDRIKPAGRAAMDAGAYSCGARIPEDAVWECCA